MSILRRIIPYLSPVLILVGLELIIKKPTWIYCLAVLLLLMVFLSVRMILESKRFRDNWRYSLTPFFLTAAILLAIVFLPNLFIRQAVIIGGSLLIGLFLESLYVYFYAPLKYQLYSLDNLAIYVNLISSFLFFFGLYSLVIFLNINIGLLTSAVFLLTVLLSSQMFWINKIPFLASKSFIFMIALIMAEVSWAVNFFPTDFYVNGLVLAIVYYIITGITRCHFQSLLSFKLIGRYLLIGALLLMLTLGTAQWH